MSSWLRRTVLGLAVCALVCGALAGSASAFTTTVIQGNIGGWVGPNPAWSYCQGSWHKVQTVAPLVARTPRYPSGNQTIWMQPRLEYTGDGNNWSLWQVGGFESSTVGPNRDVQFYSQDFTGLPVGYGYRLVMRFWWYAGSTQVGYAEDVFNHASDYYTSNSRLFQGTRGWGCSM